MHYQDNDPPQKKSGREALPSAERFDRMMERAGKCWVWVGTYKRRRGTRTPSFSTQRGYSVHPVTFAREAAGLPRLRRHLNTSKRCATENCVNPEHYGDNQLTPQDALRIVETWRRHRKHYTSLSILSRQYGVPRQEIQRVLEGAGEVHDLKVLHQEARSKRLSEFQEKLDD